MKITDKKLTALVNETLKRFVNESGLDESSTKNDVFRVYIALFSGLFFYLVALDGKDIAIKTILGFLVKITPKNKLDGYFKSLALGVKNGSDNI